MLVVVAVRKLSINSEKRKIQVYSRTSEVEHLLFLGSYDFTLEIIAGIHSYKMGMMKVAAS